MSMAGRITMPIGWCRRVVLDTAIARIGDLLLHQFYQRFFVPCAVT